MTMSLSWRTSFLGLWWEPRWKLWLSPEVVKASLPEEAMSELSLEACAAFHQ